MRVVRVYHAVDTSSAFPAPRSCYNSRNVLAIGACILSRRLVFLRHLFFLPSPFLSVFFRFFFLVHFLYNRPKFSSGCLDFAGELRGMKGNCSENNEPFAPSVLFRGKVKRYVRKVTRNLCQPYIASIGRWGNKIRKNSGYCRATSFRNISPASKLARIKLLGLEHGPRSTSRIIDPR